MPSKIADLQAKLGAGGPLGGFVPGGPPPAGGGGGARGRPTASLVGAVEQADGDGAAAPVLEHPTKDRPRSIGKRPSRASGTAGGAGERFTEQGNDNVGAVEEHAAPDLYSSTQFPPTTANVRDYSQLPPPTTAATSSASPRAGRPESSATSTSTPLLGEEKGKKKSSSSCPCCAIQ